MSAAAVVAEILIVGLEAEPLASPARDGGPYLSQEGDVFLVDDVDGETIHGRLVRARSDTARRASRRD
jgi:hypothetical protein